ncbi:MAG: L,D-transpeptidase [Gammaproteobacteria bacterium]|nr:L,D-transpeptidase [Gammaproteobacteria bacterium]
MENYGASLRRTQTVEKKPACAADCLIRIGLHSQTLRAWQRGQLIFDTLISTGAKGPGEQNGSGCTPRGRHIIRAKIGAGCPVGTVFVGRRPTGEIFTPELRELYPRRDWILTRILWLSGCEPGYNRLGDVDTMRRYIYIHGTPDDVLMGTPGSHGCVRMRNAEIIQLFDLIPAGTPVELVED